MREKIIALVFCLVILGITGTTFYNMVIDYLEPKEEKSEIAKGFEEEKEKNGTKKEEGLLQSFSDNLAGKEEGAKMASEISTATSGMTYIESTQVLLGKNDWLFFKSVEDGDPIEDYESVFRYSDEELANFAQKLEADQAIINSHGCDFYVLSNPNKSNVYSELMPDTVVKQNEKSSTDLLFEYLQTNSSIKAVNTKEDLIKAKDTHQVYYSTDTHFNQIGAYVATQTLKQAIDGQPIQKLSNVKFNVVDEHYAGDLAILANMTDIFNNDKKYEIDPSSVDVSKRCDKKILIIGDSFGQAMYPLMVHYFTEVNFVHIMEFNESYLDLYQPDVVVWESVERLTERFCWVDLWS